MGPYGLAHRFLTGWSHGPLRVGPMEGLPHLRTAGDPHPCARSPARVPLERTPKRTTRQAPFRREGCTARTTPERRAPPLPAGDVTASAAPLPVNRAVRPPLLDALLDERQAPGVRYLTESRIRLFSAAPPGVGSSANTGHGQGGTLKKGSAQPAPNLPRPLRPQ